MKNKFVKIFVAIAAFVMSSTVLAAGACCALEALCCTGNMPCCL